MTAIVDFLLALVVWWVIIAVACSLAVGLLVGYVCVRDKLADRSARKRIARFSATTSLRVCEDTWRLKPARDRDARQDRLGLLAQDLEIRSLPVTDWRERR